MPNNSWEEVVADGWCGYAVSEGSDELLYLLLLCFLAVLVVFLLCFRFAEGKGTKTFVGFDDGDNVVDT